MTEKKKRHPGWLATLDFQAVLDNFVSTVEEDGVIVTKSLNEMFDAIDPDPDKSKVVSLVLGGLKFNGENQDEFFKENVSFSMIPRKPNPDQIPITVIVTVINQNQEVYSIFVSSPCVVTPIHFNSNVKESAVRQSVQSFLKSIPGDIKERYRVVQDTDPVVQLIKRNDGSGGLSLMAYRAFIMLDHDDPINGMVYSGKKAEPIPFEEWEQYVRENSPQLSPDEITTFIWAVKAMTTEEVLKNMYKLLMGM